SPPAAPSTSPKTPPEPDPGAAEPAHHREPASEPEPEPESESEPQPAADSSPGSVCATPAGTTDTDTPSAAAAAAAAGDGAGVCGACGGGLRLAGAHGRPVTVNVTIPLSTLLGLDDHPGELDGYGPIPAHIARHLSTAGLWRWVATHDTTGV